MASDYYSHTRPEMIVHAPRNCETALSLGCGAGISESLLVQKGTNVYAVEYNQEAASVAKSNGLNVITGDVEKVDIGQFGTKFDFIIYCDILEHLKCPEDVIERHIKYLSANGRVYISIPNFRHYSVLYQLFLKGNIKYQEAGILDKTHIRLTTTKMGKSWLESLELKIINIEYIMHWRRHKWLSTASLGLLNEFVAPQIGILAEKS